LQSPFFTTLLPEQGGKLIDEAKLISGSNGKTATTAPIGQGRVSLLHYDPDVAASGDWKQDLQFLGTLMADEPPLPLALALDGDTQTAMMIQNMRPVNFTVMYIFLFVYLVLLVPVNYLVLKKLDKRELAWATTIAIVFLFTCGAYLIGGFSKGFSMIVNTVSLVEASPGQRIATAVSKALIFSPAQRSYQVKFGETNQVAKEIVTAGGDSYSPWRQNINKETPLTYIAGENGNEVDNLPISMWASRSFAMTHRYDLGGGITSALAYDKTTNRLSGTLTNNTPYTFNNCAMDYSDSDHAIFALRPGETLTIAQAIAEANPQMPKEDSTLVEAIHSEVTKRYGTFNMSSGTVTLVACTDDLHAGVPIKVNGHTSTRSLTVFVMHLPVK
jgi:hypothetical protein